MSGEDSMDELTLTGTTTVGEIKDGKVHMYTVTPEQFAECMYANHREEPMLAQLKIMDEYVIEVQEIYTP